jgi:hypothetical protein
MKRSPLRALALWGVGLIPCVAAQTPQWVDLAPFANVIEPAAAGHELTRGAAVADFNGDGMVDIVVPGSVASNYRAFLNLGGWFFIDVSPSAGMGPAPEAKMCAPADFDNDGDLDLFVCVRGAPSRLYQNNGMMMFTEIGAAAGLDFIDQAFHASWGDYDRDGDLDLYVGIRPIPGAPAANRLYRNNGDGTFTERAAAAGVTHDSLTFACMWFDYDSDGWQDLLVSSDLEFIPTRLPNSLYRNNQDGTFTDVGALVGFDQPMQAMGIDVADVGNNGRPCVYMSNTATSMGAMFGNPTTDGHVMLLWNPLSQSFDRVEQAYGTRADDVGWANFFFDYDNDGRDDLFVQHMGSPCALYKNTPTLPWPNVGYASGFTFLASECAAGHADFDNDGAIDVIQPRLAFPVCVMRNPATWGGNRWLKVKLVGTQSNRDGYGARVRAATSGDGVIRTAWMKSGTGFVVGNEPIVHFGLGANTVVSALEITWPSGVVQVVSNVASNQRLVVTEPTLMLGAPESSGMRSWQVHSEADPSRFFVTALSAGTTGVPVGDRTVPLAFDDLFVASLAPGNPFITGNIGLLDATGSAAGTLWAPSIPELAGISFYAATLTADLSPAFAPRSVLGPLTVTL